MVDLSERVREIGKLVDDGKYFTINRARQYGKTTTLARLADYLKKDYDVLSLDFQKISDASFQSEEAFVKAFSRNVLRRGKKLPIPDSVIGQLNDFVRRKEDKAVFDELFSALSDWCEEADKPIVMIIDEVDSATSNQVFLDFLAQLRADYLEREDDPEEKTFQSVILAGVTDVKHLRSKIRDEDQHRVNSPWNIAADFTVDMSLSEPGIRGMLEEYEADHHTGMDTGAAAKEIRAYTEGYPFLVSRICQRIDEEVMGTMSPSEAWSRKGIDEAVKLILTENNTLFQSVTGKLENYPELKASLRGILMEGRRLSYNPQQEEIVQLQMYGLIRNDHGTVRIANRIFETMLYNLFLSEEELKNSVFTKEGEWAKNQFITDRKLNMRLIMDRFIKTWHEVLGPLEDRFKEKDGRELFLLYLKPIINGSGNYYIEAQTRDQTRTDVIVDYLGTQYIIELKIWRGERYNTEGEKQIAEYLEYFGLDTGYMLSFNFNRKKETGVKRVQIGDKFLFEGTV
ncbi:MAG: AAA-like domain-containing protein [Oscillospiraceae bacterium]|nr:AAA-like domain-containing protein [Oscillospiraceae bacterium]